MKRFKAILLVADPERKDGAALERAVTLAENNQARLSVIDVLEMAPADIQIPIKGLSPETLQDKLVEARRGSWKG
jgi:nucleotide-binding universal stress UspA family protein